MAFQRLNIRAKKSFPGLYSFDSVEDSPSKYVLPGRSQGHTDLTAEAMQCTSSLLLAQISPQIQKSVTSKTSEPSWSAARARILLAKTVPQNARSCLVLCEASDP
jgi:hypothetical protein